MPQTVKRKGIKLNQGDLLRLKLPDGRLGHAVIVDRGALPSGGIPYLALFRSALARWPDAEKIYEDGLALAGWTTDALVYHGQWEIVSHNFPVPEIPFPNFKVKQEDTFYVTDYRGTIIDIATSTELNNLDYQFSVSAAIFQDAFEALHGYGEWKDHYQKLTLDYARKRRTRSTAWSA